MIEQVPTETSVTAAPVTVQIPAELLVKLTARPEVAVAVKLTGPALRATSAGCGKLIVCDPCSTLKVTVTGAAAEKVALPAWVAVIEQVPTDTNVALVPETVQIAAELLV